MIFMLKLAAVGVVGILSAALAAQAVMTLNRPRPSADMRRAEAVNPAASDTPLAAPLASQAVVTAPQASGLVATVLKSSDGHYWADATVNGQTVRVLVDTGASEVALTQTDAMRLGISPGSLNYSLQVTTANGQTRAAPVKLSYVSVAGAQVQNVDALVIENGLQTSLLGMTYLGRLSQFEATQTALILHP